MKTKLLCLLIAVGGVIVCFQQGGPKGTDTAWDLRTQAQPQIAIAVDRDALSQQILMQPAFSSDFDLAQTDSKLNRVTQFERDGSHDGGLLSGRLIGQHINRN